MKRVFADLGVVATPDVIELYEMLGGMLDTDEEFWRLWPLAEVREENQKKGVATGVLFSDYLIACWCYRLKPVNAMQSAVYVDYFNGAEPTLVARSLEEFFDAYLADPRTLLDAPGPA